MRNTASLRKKPKKAVNSSFEKVIFIDRDGVINFDPIGDYIKSWSGFKFLPGVLRALKELSRLGYGIMIISNQAGVGDGVFSEKSLNEITKKMLAVFKKEGIAVRAVYYCLHGKRAGCNCRKPKTGLFERAARDFNFQPALTYFIGDKQTDVQAGKNFGLRTIFVLTGHGRFDVMKLKKNEVPDLIADDLLHAVHEIEKEESLFP